MPTGKQIKAARAVLNWSVRDLATRTGIGTATINRYEVVSGFPISRKGYLNKIRETFEDRGVHFVETGDGYFGVVFKGQRKIPELSHPNFGAFTR